MDRQPVVTSAFLALLLVGGAACGVLPSQGRAQDTPKLAPGVRIRVTELTGTCSLGARVTPCPPTRTQIGTLAGLRADTLLYALETAQDTARTPLGAISELDVSRGERSHVGRGAAIGAASGFLLGVALCKALTSCETWGEAPISSLASPVGVIFMLIGLPVGAALGGHSTEDWASVPRDRWRLSVLPLRRSGLTLAISIPL